MKIVMLGPFGMHPRGTMSYRALPLAKALAARGHRVTLVLPPWQNPEDAGRAWEEDGVRVENVALPAGVPGWFHARLTAALVRRTRELRPDVVHAFKPKAYAGLAHLALARRFPVVVDTDDWEGPGGWNDLSPYPAPLKVAFAWQERWGLRHARAVTAASRALQTLAWATGGPPERVVYLPNGVTPVELPPRTENERPTLLLYTRFFEFELARLWRIVAAVRDQRPDARLVVAGQGFFAEEARLLALVREAGWRVADPGSAPLAQTLADLAYVGPGSPTELAAHFAQADVALYLFDDTLLNRTKCPVKLLDLLAAGIPVVGDAVGQLRESVRPGESGLLVPPGDEAAFVAAVLALLEDTQSRRAMGSRAAADMRERFSWAALAQVAEAAYARAVEIGRC